MEHQQFTFTTVLCSFLTVFPFQFHLVFSDPDWPKNRPNSHSNRPAKMGKVITAEMYAKHYSSNKTMSSHKN